MDYSSHPARRSHEKTQNIHPQVLPIPGHAELLGISTERDVRHAKRYIKRAEKLQTTCATVSICRSFYSFLVTIIIIRLPGAVILMNVYGHEGKYLPLGLEARR